MSGLYHTADSNYKLATCPFLHFVVRVRAFQQKPFCFSTMNKKVAGEQEINHFVLSRRRRLENKTRRKIQQQKLPIPINQPIKLVIRIIMIIKFAAYKASTFVIREFK